QDYFVLKPKHSAFFATPLELLLKYLEVDRLVLCGFSGDQCVMLSAADAYLRDMHLHVPSDCVASMNPRENARVLSYMQRNFDANTTPSADLDLARLSRRGGGEDG